MKICFVRPQWFPFVGQNSLSGEHDPDWGISGKDGRLNNKSSATAVTADHGVAKSNTQPWEVSISVRGFESVLCGNSYIKNQA